MSDHDCTLERCGVLIHIWCQRCDRLIGSVRQAHAEARRTLHDLAHDADRGELRATQKEGIE